MPKWSEALNSSPASMKNIAYEIIKVYCTGKHWAWMEALMKPSKLNLKEDPMSHTHMVSVEPIINSEESSSWVFGRL